MIRKILLTSLVALPIMVSTTTATIAQKASNTLRWASAIGMDSPDPYYNTAREMIVVTGQEVWDTLIYRDPKTQAYVPLLAKSWEWLDNKTLQVTLRDDVKWQDGKPLTVDDAVYTFNYIADPAHKLPNKAFVEWIDKATAAEDHVFQLHLKAPFPPALEYLASVLPVLPKDFYNSDGKPPELSKIVGTGPYRLVKFTPGGEVEVSRSPLYFKDGPKGSPSFDKIIFRRIPDVSTQIAELVSGGVDWLWNVPPDQANFLRSKPGVHVAAGETMRFSYLQIETRSASGSGKSPLQDIKVRQAIAKSINRQAIIDNLIGKPSQIPAALCFYTQVGCSSDVQQISYDPDGAKKLLAEAGYPNGFSVDLQGFRNRDWLDAVGGYLSAVGIKVQANFVPYAAAQQRIADRKSGLTLSDWGSFSVNDTYSALKPFFDKSAYDTAQDDQITQWVTAAMLTPDGDVRKKNYLDALRKNADQLYVLPMWTHSNVYAHNNELNFTTYPDENPRFYLGDWK